MVPSRYGLVDRHPVKSGSPRVAIATALAGLMLFALSSFAGAQTLVPSVDTGGSGGSDNRTVSEMLRGDYSPIDIGSPIAVTEVSAPMTVSEMLRGDLSPIDTGPEVAVVEAQSVESAEEMLRGDLSPIALDIT